MQSLEEFESADYLPMLKHERQGEWGEPNTVTCSVRVL